MKRKRKLEGDSFFLDMVIEMTWHGFKRGIAFGALYGVLVLLLWDRVPDSRYLVTSLPLAMMLGLPFGAAFGMTAGVVLGIMNGLLTGILTRLLLPTPQDWKLYRSALAAFCGTATLVGGVIVFDAVNIMVSENGFFAFVVAPALIAAIVFARASERAADSYIVAIEANE